jgi:signal transduction histidine kinase
MAARVTQLLDAMRSVGGEVDLRVTLDRICETAASLTDARYSALGVVDEHGDGLSQFFHHGMSEETARRIGHLPDGHRGLLGALVRDPRPVLLTDLTTDPRACGFPEHHPAMRSFLGVPVRVRGEVFGNLYLAEKRGGEAFNEYDLNYVRVLATEAGIAIEHARLHEAARQRARWIEGSVAVTTALLSGGDHGKEYGADDGGAGQDGHASAEDAHSVTSAVSASEEGEPAPGRDTGRGPGPDMDDALQVVAEQARRLSGSAAGMVLLPDGTGGLEVVAVDSARPTRALGTVLPPESEIAKELLAGRAVFVDDAATDPRTVTVLAADYGPAMLLPLRSGGRVLGSLVTPRAPGERTFTEVERTLAVQFASQAALALRMAEAQRDRERLAVYEDRDRIARDLHDLVVQRLFATGMMLESAQRRSAEPGVEEGIGRAVDELDVTIQEIRTAIFALQQGPAEAPSGLRTRVLREISTVAVPLGFKPSHRFVGPVDATVGDMVGKNLVAALREALSNAFRHAEAGRIEVVVDATVTLPGGRPGVRLTVADDGVGIPGGGRRSGLRNLRKRAESLGGDSRHGPGIGDDGAGTTLVWEAPR